MAPKTQPASASKPQYRKKVPASPTSKSQGMGAGDFKGGLPAKRLGTPTNIVLNAANRLKRSRKSFQKLCIKTSLAELAPVIGPNEIKSVTNGRRMFSICKRGPNQRNKSNKTGNKITPILLAVASNPVVIASIKPGGGGKESLRGVSIIIILFYHSLKLRLNFEVVIKTDRTRNLQTNIFYLCAIFASRCLSWHG